jgi:CDP-diacylglycerol--serine O-phosphatidyltransferase
VRTAYIFPNLITTASLWCGGWAILNAINVSATEPLNSNGFVLSCWLIIIAAILDLLDGLVARVTRTESTFGAQLDSLADVIAFGVAPAILIYTRMRTVEPGMPMGGAELMPEVFTLLYISCGALRLARFNVQKASSEKKSFTGMPIPAAAGILVSTFLFVQKLDPEWERANLHLAIYPLMFILSVLMVSRVSYPSIKQLNLNQRKPFDALPVIVMVAALGVLAKNVIEIVVFGGFLSYLIIGLIGHWIWRPVAESVNTFPDRGSDPGLDPKP